MAQRITGLDIGTYAVRVVHLEINKGVEIVGYDDELLRPHESPGTPGAAPMPAGSVASEAGAISPASEMAEDARIAGAPPSEPEGVMPVGDATLPPWARAVMELARRGNFQEGMVVTSLPEARGMTILQEVPFDVKSKVLSVLPHLLLDRLPMDLQKVTYDFQIQSGGTEPPEALVGFARTEDIAGFLETLRATGVDPHAVSVPELALWAVAERSLGTGTGPWAMLDVGHRHARLLVMEGGRVSLARTIPVGGHHITEAIARAGNCSYEEAERFKHQVASLEPESEIPDANLVEGRRAVVQALAPLVREVRRSLQGLYAQKRVAVETIYLCGGTSRLRHLDHYLNEEFGVACAHLPMGEVREEVRRMVGEPRVMAPSATLALQVAQDRQERRTLNLRQGPLAYRGASSALRRELVLMAAAAAALLCLVGAVLYTQRLDHIAQRDAMRAAVEAHTKQMFGESLTSQAQIRQRLEGGTGGEKGFVPRVSAYELMYQLSQHMEADLEVSLDRIEVDVDRQVVQIAGITSDAQSVDRLVSSLEKLSCLREVRKDSLQVRSDNEVQFQLNISSGCS